MEIAEQLALWTPLIALIPSLIVLRVIRIIDQVEREPLAPILMALFFGTLSTIPVLALGGYFEEIAAPLISAYGIDAYQSIIYAPISEELSKFILLALFVRIFSKQMHSFTDFLVYSCAIAIGFELIENILYQWSSILENEEYQLLAWLEMTGMRTVGGAGMHLLFSVWNGVALWTFLRVRSSIRLISGVACIIIAIGFHAINNGSVVFYDSNVIEEAPNQFALLFNIVNAANSNLALASFIVLIISAVVHDAKCLVEFRHAVLKKEIRPRDKAFAADIEAMTDPANHLLANSLIAWRFFDNGHTLKKNARIFSEFARIALRYSRVISDTTRDYLIKDAVLLISND